MPEPLASWPFTAEELIELQQGLATRARLLLERDPWVPAGQPLVGGCFVAFGPGGVGPGGPGDRAWAGAATWRPPAHSRAFDGLADLDAWGGRGEAGAVVAEVVASAAVGSRYVPGLLALREGPILHLAVARLSPRPELIMVDATGLDHPRRAGLALHLGAVTGIPSVGVTHRPLVAEGPLPPPRRGALAPVELEGSCVGYWVCTRSGVRPVVAHAGWRTTPETAALAVLASSTNAARTPIPLRQARMVAREARARRRL